MEEPLGWREALAAARSRQNASLPADVVSRLRERAAETTPASCMADLPVGHLQSRLVEINRTYMALLQARGLVAWPHATSQASQTEGALEAAPSIDARLFVSGLPERQQRAAHAFAARGHLTAQLGELRRLVQARSHRQATLQRYMDLAAAVDAKKRMVAALAKEVEAARSAVAIADATSR